MQVEFNEDIIKFTDTIIKTAIDYGASDIHIEANSQESLVRVRLDGDLHKLASAPLAYHQEIIARIKILSELDIAERRLPQDGRISLEEGIDLRISIIPTVRGESVVIRILNNKKNDLDLEDLNFNQETKKLLEDFSKQKSGFLVVTGPTSSGKTTSLYSVLKLLNKEENSLITIEDPVEYRLEGARQIQVNDAIGMSFARGLRSILRNDPDIIMVGEIRDKETAEIAVRSAITGHLVLTSLHTKDAFSAIIRLLDMGIEPYLLASSLSLVQSQRLIKKLCPHCKESYEPTRQEKDLVFSVLAREVGDKKFYRPKGCDQCLNGYSGRQVVAEIFKMDDDIRKLIKEKADLSELKDLAAEKSFRTMLDDGIQRVIDGQIYLDDLLRATIDEV